MPNAGSVNSGEIRRLVLVRKAMTMRTVLAAIFTISCSDSSAASQEVGETTRLDLVGCSDGGGEVLITYTGNNMNRWELTIYGSSRVTEAVISGEDPHSRTLAVERTYHDGSRITYSIDTATSEGELSPDGMLMIDFADTIDEDVQGISELYFLSVEAANEGRGEVSCDGPRR